MPIVTRSGKGSALTHAEMDGNLQYLVPPGAVMAFARNSAPDGWIECNGSAISRSVYADLFAAIGTTFGAGNGSSTFNVPNLRGEFIRGWDNGRNVDAGRTFGSAQAEEIKTHNHALTDPGHSHSVSDPGHNHTVSPAAYAPGAAPGSRNMTPSQVGWGTQYTTTSATTGITVGSNSTGISIQSTGGAETRPRNIAMLYCIKV